MTTALKEHNVDYARRRREVRLNAFQFEFPEKAPMSDRGVSGIKRRLRLEELLYFSARLTVVFILLFAFLYSDFILGSLNSWITAIALPVLYLLASARLSSETLVPPRLRRLSFRNFAGTEARFAILMVAVIYFGSLNLQPEVLAILLAGNFLLQYVLFTGWRAFNRRQLKTYRPDGITPGGKNVIIVGTSNNAKKTTDLILRYPDLDFRILGFVDFRQRRLWRYRDIPLLGHTDDLNDLIRSNRIDLIVMATEPEDYYRSRRIFEQIEKMGIDICVLPAVGNLSDSKCETVHIDGEVGLVYRASCRSPLERLAKNIFDKIAAIGGLIISGPVMLIAAGLIRLDSRGPIFFKQVRIGKNGRLFTMLKLRTMIMDADQHKGRLQHLNEMSGPVFKIRNDPRVTRIGKILRKFSIDEFPQFFNILKGDMSLVGPRPALPREVAQYEPWQRRKLSVKPGATCLWQINGRNHVDFEEWMNLDLKYIDNWSLREDTRIFLKTFPAVIKGKGAS
jgi:exopolysaccharide biosynthesis polyprenyl glycosylphosphotransferase